MFDLKMYCIFGNIKDSILVIVDKFGFYIDL